MESKVRSHIVCKSFKSKMLSAANCTSKILLPFNHVVKRNVDSLQNKIYLAFNHWLKLPSDKLQTIVDSIDNLHYTQKLLDDIQESSSSQSPAAHVLYGIPLTVNAAIFMSYNSLQKIQCAGLAGEVGQVYSEQMLSALRGRGLEIYWRDNNYWPSEEEYNQMVEDKVGGMFYLGVRLMQLFSDDKNNYSKVTKLLALYFQIRNDYFQLKQREAVDSVTETSRVDDLGGRISLPIIHALRASQGTELQNRLRRPVKDVKAKQYFLSELERLGSFEYTRDVLLNIDLQARGEVDRLGGNPEMEYVLDELLAWRTLGRQSKYEVIERPLKIRNIAERMTLIA